MATTIAIAPLVICRRPPAPFHGQAQRPKAIQITIAARTSQLTTRPTVTGVVVVYDSPEPGKPIVVRILRRPIVIQAPR